MATQFCIFFALRLIQYFEGSNNLGFILTASPDALFHFDDSDFFSIQPFMSIALLSFPQHLITLRVEK